MSNEKEKIVAMLDAGKISPEDALRLLEALDAKNPKPSPSVAKAEVNPSLKGKKLRVKVDGNISDIEGAEGVGVINVNVAVPLALAKIADDIISNVIPNEVSKELASEGIDLKALNIGGIIDTLTDLDEDIVNVDIERKGKPLTVRVYVE